MDNCSNSYVNPDHSYLSLKNYNKVVSGLVVGPPEPKNTPSMNKQIVLNYQTPYNPYDALTYDSQPGNYYTVSSGQYGSKTCQVNMPRQCVGPPSSGPPVSGPPVSGPPAKRAGSSCMTGTQNPCRSSTLQCQPIDPGRPGGQGTCVPVKNLGKVPVKNLGKVPVKNLGKVPVKNLGKVPVNNLGKLDFGSGGYYRVKAYGCNGCRWASADGGGSQCCTGNPSKCLGKGWTLNWSSDFCTEDFGIIYISGNGEDNPYEMKREGSCYDLIGSGDGRHWDAIYCGISNSNSRKNYNIISAKGHLESAIGHGRGYREAIGNDEQAVFIGNCSTAEECVIQKMPAFLLTPTASEGKKPDSTWCDSGRDEECESGVCGWIVDDEGDLKWEQCCKEKSFDYGNKSVFLCDDRTEGQTCYKDKNCAKGFCTDYECKKVKSSWTYCGGRRRVRER